MRVIAGSLGGRNFDAPHGHKTHPMSDKARGGLFNALGDIEGLSVLDAFSGTGALSIEAISRGAATALAIDSDKNAQRAISDNIRSLGLGRQLKLVRATVGAWSSTNDGLQFDLVLCDPPYDDLQLQTVEKLSAHVRPGGLLVLSWPGRNTPPDLPDLTTIKVQSYNDIQLCFYRK